ncbi:MAG: DUF4883 family protein [Clostridium sp.]|nr:DUF4883 family protein [Clostridium sp.]
MKYLKLIFILLLCSILSGCIFDDPKYINLKSKPNLYYYSNEIYKKVMSNEDYSLKVFDSNFYEYHDVSQEDLNILPEFLESLNTNNYVDELNLENEKVKYKLIIEFNNSNSKYIINIYNKDYITLFPWDGNLEEDMITMDGIPIRNNLYSFCIYIINKANSNS